MRRIVNQTQLNLLKNVFAHCLRDLQKNFFTAIIHSLISLTPRIENDEW